MHVTSEETLVQKEPVCRVLTVEAGSHLRVKTAARQRMRTRAPERSLTRVKEDPCSRTLVTFKTQGHRAYLRESTSGTFGGCRVPMNGVLGTYNWASGLQGLGIRT